MKKVAVVILNWNGKSFLEKFLPSVIEYSKGFAELIIADNASTDDSITFLQTCFPEIRVIVLKENFGFSKGYNEALKQVKADYYVLLNSDIEVTENWIAPVIELMESDDSIAVCQPKLLSYHEPNKFEYAGAAGGFVDKWGYPFCRGRLFQTMEEDTGQYDNECEIFWGSGACMFVKATIYHEFGGLDEDFFAHMEEIDFCWRLKNSGYKIMYTSASKVFHVGGGTLPKKSSRKTYLNFRNNIILLYKNLPTKRIIPVFFVRFFLDLIAAFRFLFDSGAADMMAVFKAHISFYVMLKRNLKKRKRIKHIHVSKTYNKSIISDYYLKGVKTFSSLSQRYFQ
jgi:GT2 family glycosyltransferase